MGVNDIAMACQYKFSEAPPLDIPITSFDGLADNTIDPGELWTLLGVQHECFFWGGPVSVSSLPLCVSAVGVFRGHQCWQCNACCDARLSLRPVDLAAAGKPRLRSCLCSPRPRSLYALQTPAQLNLLLCCCCCPVGNVAQWGQYTTGPYRNIPIEGGDHYFVSTHYQVRNTCRAGLSFSPIT